VDIMTANNGGSKGRKRRLLTPQEQYQVWVAYLAGEGSQAELADKWGVDRSTVVQLVKTAKDGALDRLATARPGRPGKTARDAELEDAHAEIERLKATVCEQAVELHLYRGK
jgi:transposase